MLARTGSFLIPSLIVHGACFAALAGTPLPVRSNPVDRAIEFITITDDGGGRVGNDTQIGDAAKPAEVPERVFRQVRAKPKRPKPKPVAKPAPERTEPEPAAPSGTDESGEAAVAHNDDGGATGGQSILSGSAGTNPNATRAGIGSGAEGVDRRSALRAWLRDVQREVNKIASRNYPRSALRMRLEGRLRLGVTIGPDGEIVSVRVLSSSGHRVLDDSATASVHALRIPAPPETLGWREREISLPIHYALD